MDAVLRLTTIDESSAVISEFLARYRTAAQEIISAVSAGQLPPSQLGPQLGKLSQAYQGAIAQPEFVPGPYSGAYKDPVTGLFTSPASKVYGTPQQIGSPAAVAQAGFEKLESSVDIGAARQREIDSLRKSAEAVTGKAGDEDYLAVRTEYSAAMRSLNAALSGEEASSVAFRQANLEASIQALKLNTALAEDQTASRESIQAKVRNAIVQNQLTATLDSEKAANSEYIASVRQAAAAHKSLTDATGEGGGGRGSGGGGILGALTGGAGIGNLIGTTAAFSAGFTVVNQIRDAVGEASKFQVAMADVQQRMEDLGRGDQFGKVREQIQGIAESTGQLASELAPVAVQLQAAFGGVEQGQAATQAVAELARVSGSSLPEVANNLEAVGKAYGLTGDQLSHASDLIYGASERAGVSVGETTRAVGILAQSGDFAGVSLDKLANVLAVVEQRTGTAGTQAAERLTRSLTQVETKIPQLLDLTRQIPELGVTPAIANQGTFAIIDQIGKAWDHLNQSQQAVIVNLLGGGRQAQAVVALFEGYNEILGNTAQSANDAGKAHDAFKKSMDTLSGTVAKLKEDFAVFIQQLSQAGVFKGLEEVLGLAGGLLKTFNDISDALGGIPAQIAAIFLAIKAGGLLGGKIFGGGGAAGAAGAEGISPVAAGGGGAAVARVGVADVAAAIGTYEAARGGVKFAQDNGLTPGAPSGPGPHLDFSVGRVSIDPVAPVATASAQKKFAQQYGAYLQTLPEDKVLDVANESIPDWRARSFNREHAIEETAKINEARRLLERANRPQNEEAIKALQAAGDINDQQAKALEEGLKSGDWSTYKTVQNYLTDKYKGKHPQFVAALNSAARQQPIAPADIAQQILGDQTVEGAELNLDLGLGSETEVIKALRDRITGELSQAQQIKDPDVRTKLLQGASKDIKDMDSRLSADMTERIQSATAYFESTGQSDAQVKIAEATLAALTSTYTQLAPSDTSGLNKLFSQVTSVDKQFTDSVATHAASLEQAASIARQGAVNPDAVKANNLIRAQNATSVTNDNARKAIQVQIDQDKQLLQSRGNFFGRQDVVAELAQLEVALGALPTADPLKPLLPEKVTDQALALQINQAKRARDLARTRSIDPVRQTQNELDSARQNLADVRGLGDIIKSTEAEKAVYDAAFAHSEALRQQSRQLLSAQAQLDRVRAHGDPAAVAAAAINEARQLLGRSDLTPSERVSAQAQLEQGQFDVTRAQQANEVSGITLIESLAKGHHDEVAVAKANVVRQLTILNQVRQNTPGDIAALNNQQAQVYNAITAAGDAENNAELSHAQFLVHTHQASQNYYIGVLKRLRDQAISSQQSQTEIDKYNQQIYDAERQTTQNLQFDLPQTFKLPTLYEVRRLQQTPLGQGYNDNRQVVVNINTQGMSTAAVTSAVSSALGTDLSRYGTANRLY